jgi:hypothetical protein
MEYPMVYKIGYMWVVEILGETSGEVIEKNHQFSYAKACKFAKNLQSFNIGIVRDIYDDEECLYDRSWAYIEDGELPEYFIDEYGIEVAKVPPRFHKQMKDDRYG